jgi:uncharacterized protein YbjT (DUF2867 family)
VRTPQKVTFVEQLGAEAGVFDLEDSSTLKPHLYGVTHIINTSYISYAPNVLKAVKDNRELCHGLERLIFVGSTGVYTRLESESAERKRIGERAILKSGVPFTILRPTMIYGHARDGNISHLFRSFQKYPVFSIFGDGHSKVQPIYIGDVVEAVVVALECAETLNKTYDIAGPIPMTYRDLLEQVARILGRRILFVHLPLGVAVALVRVLSAFKISPVSVEQVLRLAENKDVDIAPAKNDFNFGPIAFEKGLQWELLDMEREARLLKSEAAT